MPALILQIVIIVLVVAFFYWVYLKVTSLFAPPPPFKEVLDVLVLILCVAIVLFYAIIPILQAVGHMSFSAIGH
jgi:hypothetical protein